MVNFELMGVALSVFVMIVALVLRLVIGFFLIETYVEVMLLTLLVSVVSVFLKCMIFFSTAVVNWCT